MILYQVKNTKKTKGFEQCTFVETKTGIYAESRLYPFFKHPTITTPELLREHLQQLEEEDSRSSNQLCRRD